MAAALPSQHECPVCHEDFTEPKLLPCTHLVCRKCVVSWLDKGGKDGGCPLCRAAIIPEASQGQGDLVTLVDDLPTDLSTAAVIESKKLLSGEQVCSCCEDAEAASFCLQCYIKLCESCSRTHSKIPAAQGHVTENLTSLTAEQLASNYQSACVNHGNRQAELYCTSHTEMICMLCATCTHRKCSDVEGIEGVATAKREELKAQGQRLKVKEEAVSAKISKIDTEVANTKAKFKAMREEVKTRFDDLQRSLDTQRQKHNGNIQEREAAYLQNRSSLRADLEKYRGTVAAHKGTVEQLVMSAPDGPLLGMATKLKSRLDSLESQAACNRDDTGKQAVIGDIVFDQQLQDHIKRSMVAFGEQNKTGEVPSSSSSCAMFENPKSGLEGPDLAAVIKVGDRVRRGKDWRWGNQDGNPPGLGSVTLVPSDLKTQWVKVKWDCGGEYVYRIGRGGMYDLKLA